MVFQVKSAVFPQLSWGGAVAPLMARFSSTTSCRNFAPCHRRGAQGAQGPGCSWGAGEVRILFTSGFLWLNLLSKMWH